MSDSRLVYSTGTANECPRCQRALHKCRCQTQQPQSESGNGVRIQRQTKGRGGKEVTVISGFTLPANEIKILAKKLKTQCGSGGSVKGSSIEIQGDQRQKVLLALQEAGFEVRLGGG